LDKVVLYGVGAEAKSGGSQKPGFCRSLLSSDGNGVGVLRSYGSGGYARCRSRRVCKNPGSI